MYQIHGPVSTAGGWSLKFPPMLSLSPSMIEPLMSPGPATSSCEARLLASVPEEAI